MEQLISKISSQLSSYIHYVDAYLSQANHLKSLSMTLMLLALVLFLILIILIFIRSLTILFTGNNPTKKISAGTSDQDDLFYIEDDDSEELEKELQKDLDLAIAERNLIQQQEEFERQKAAISEQAKTKAAEKQDQAAKETSSYQHKEPTVKLDWQKGKIPPVEFQNDLNAEPVSLSYQQSKQELHLLLGLIIDMIGRGVDDLKIAQTLNFKTQGLVEENEIIKAIDAVKQFLSLCISGEFAKLKRYNDLPREDQALYHLANGDVSLALALLEELMDTKIDHANNSASEEKRQQLYAEISLYACCFGALAEQNDLMLATSAYELAIELQSTNVMAWSRLGDVYVRANSLSKAAWAYKNVLSFADSEIDIAYIANANRHLSEQLYAQGNSLQAANLYNSSKQYYDSLGINRRLDKQEIEIIGIIETNYQQSLPQTIQKILSASHQKA